MTGLKQLTDSHPCPWLWRTHHDLNFSLVIPSARTYTVYTHTFMIARRHHKPAETLPRVDYSYKYSRLCHGYLTVLVKMLAAVLGPVIEVHTVGQSALLELVDLHVPCLDG